MAEGELRRALIISGERYLYSYPIYKYHSYSDDHYLSDHSLPYQKKTKDWLRAIRDQTANLKSKMSRVYGKQKGGSGAKPMNIGNTRRMGR